ncbi:intein-containing abc transporter a family member 1-related precursor [Anaeramoeba ignava]|uniref:Intein-containing abc transporter a family member 1-related n=1 Tax=Anaeramoeba ignava TaxID=1746090 RepID=A0A9Q0RI37_ANAIG|nr:intein-containing abc transporter a family member 1-related precursor [Anaeramoeba ignava]
MKLRIHQTRTLLRKNWIQSKRNLKSTLCTILVPVIFNVLLLIFGAIIKASRLDANKGKNPKLEPINFPKCDTIACYDFVYNEKNNTKVQEIVQKICDNEGINKATSTLGFDTANEVDYYLSNNTNKTYVGYMFLLPNGSYNDIPDTTNFSVVVNQSTIYQSTGLDDFLDVFVPAQYALQKALFEVLQNKSMSFDVTTMKYPHPQLTPTDAIPIMAPTFYFWSALFQLVIQMTQIVQEKEYRQRFGMIVMGLKGTSYWISWFIANFITIVISIFLQIATGAMFQFEFFLENAFGTYFFLFFLFGLTTISLAFFFTSILGKTKTTTTVGFVMFFFFTILNAITTNVIFQSSVPSWVRTILSFLPPVVFSKGVFDLADKTSAPQFHGIRWADRGHNASMYSLTTIYNWLILDFVIFFVLALYLDNVVPSSSGIARHPLFFLQKSYWTGKYKKKKQTQISSETDNLLDADVLQEKKMIADGESPETTAVSIVNLTKVFKKTLFQKKTDFKAVDSLFLTLRNGELLGLLGPNGSGKCLGLGTPVIKYNGDVVPVETISIGDVLLGDDSSPRRVLATTRGTGPLFNITPLKNPNFVLPYTVNDKHILSLKLVQNISYTYDPLSSSVTVRWIQNHTLMSRIFPNVSSSYLPFSTPHIAKFIRKLRKSDKINHCGDVVDISVTDFIQKPHEWKSMYHGYKVGASFAKQQSSPKKGTLHHLGVVLGNFIRDHRNSQNFSSISSQTHPQLAQLLSAISPQGIPNIDNLRKIALTDEQDRREFLSAVVTSAGSVISNKENIAEIDCGNQKEIRNSLEFIARSLGLAFVSVPNQKQHRETIRIFGSRIENFWINNGKKRQKTNEKAKTRKSMEEEHLSCEIRVEPAGMGEYYGFEIDGNGRFLLGDFTVTHNSTTINMLIGLFRPTSGDAFILGRSIITDIDAIRRQLGVCPQHDILWDELTAKEHLELFAKLKNMKSKEIKDEISQRLEEVELSDVANLRVGAFSGGMKRRLSLAIALTGSPKICLFDECTTGLDPVARRQVWNIIQKAKKDRVILLTTHSMEEADILSDRIAILAAGKLRCLGTSLHLKNKFGAGYRINIIIEEESNIQPLRTGILKQFPDFQIYNETQSTITITVQRHLNQKLPSFFRFLDDNRENFKIKDFAVSLTTLEEVFLNIANQAQREQAQKLKEQLGINNLMGQTLTDPLLMSQEEMKFLEHSQQKPIDNQYVPYQKQGQFHPPKDKSSDPLSLSDDDDDN